MKYLFIALMATVLAACSDSGGTKGASNNACPNLEGEFATAGSMSIKLKFQKNAKGALEIVLDDGSILPVDGQSHKVRNSEETATATCSAGKISISSDVNGKKATAIITPTATGFNLENPADKEVHAFVKTGNTASINPSVGHSQNECPKIADGKYATEDSAAKVSHNQSGQLVFQFDQDPSFTVNGQLQVSEKDGAKVIASCKAGVVQLALTDPEDGKQVQASIEASPKGFAVKTSFEGYGYREFKKVQ